MTTLLNYPKLTLVRAMSAARRALIGRQVEAVLVRCDNGIFLVDVEDMCVGRRLARDGKYGTAELDRLLSVPSISFGSKVFPVMLDARGHGCFTRW